MEVLNNCFSTSAQKSRAEFGDTCKPFCVTVRNFLYSSIPNQPPSFPSLPFLAGWLAVCLSRYFQPDSPQLTTILLDIRRRNALPMRREGCDGVGRIEGDKTDLQPTITSRGFLAYYPPEESSFLHQNFM